MITECRLPEFEIVDIGIENSHFQGFGVAYTPYTDCIVGRGSDAREAMDDALEQLAMSTDNVDIEVLEQEIMRQYPGFWDQEAVADTSVESYLKRENPDEWFDENGEWLDDSECELYYYVGIRWKGVAPLNPQE